MWEKELKSAISAGLSVIKPIMDIYNSNFEVEIKDDNSPVTLADKTADKIIRETLKKEYPNHAFLTEESVDTKDRLANDYVWIVDPVDGTKDFVGHDGGFTTNIALAYKHELVVGVVVIPTTNEVYYASKGNGAYYMHDGVVEQIHVNNKIKNLKCLCSVYHTQPEELALINKHRDVISSVEKVGSSTKACLIASGKAEISFRLSAGTKEWDTAAPQIIVEEAGGVFKEPDGSLIKYNREDVYNRKGYIIANNETNFKLK